MEPNQLPDPAEITQEMWDDVPDPQVDGNDSDFHDADAPAAPAPDGEEAAPAPAPADPEPTTPEVPADPYAGLPEPVRKALESVQTLEQRVRSAEGRVAAIQREKAQASAPAPAAEAPKPKAIDAIREELPEVAAAIEEAAGQRIDPDALRQQLKAETLAELQEELLNDQRANWAAEVTSKEFQAWLATQPDAEQVRSTGKATVLLKALARYDEATAAERARQDTQATRQRRVAAAVTPASASRKPAVSTEDMSDDEYWDHITKDG